MCSMSCRLPSFTEKLPFLPRSTVCVFTLIQPFPDAMSQRSRYLSSVRHLLRRRAYLSRTRAPTHRRFLAQIRLDQQSKIAPRHAPSGLVEHYTCSPPPPPHIPPGQSPDSSGPLI